MSLRPTVPTDAEYGAARSGAIAGGRALVLRHAVVGLLSLAGTTVLVRSVGAADWAVVAQGYFIVSFLELSLNANLLGGMLQRSGRAPQRELEAAARLTAVAALMILAICALLAVPAAEVLGRWEWGLCIVAVGIGGVVFAVRSVPIALLERDLEYRTVALAEIADQVTFYALAIPAIALGLGVPGILAALALRSLPSAVLLRRRRPTPLVGINHRREVGELLTFARPSMGSGLLYLIDGLIPLAVLGAAHDEVLGFILTTSTIVGYAATVQVVAQRVGFASLARLRGDDQAFRFATARAITVSTVVIVLAMLPIGGLAGVYLPVLFGSAWEAAAPVLALIGAGLLLQSPSNLATAALNASDRPRAVLGLRCAQTGTYAVLAVPLTDADPLLGVPIAFVAGRAVGAVLAVWLIRKDVVTRLLPWLILIPAAAAATIVGLTELEETQTLLASLLAATLALVWMAVNHRALRTLARSSGLSAPR